MKKSNWFILVVALLLSSTANAQPVESYDEQPLQLKKRPPSSVAETTTPIVIPSDAMTVSYTHLTLPTILLV